MRESLCWVGADPSSRGSATQFLAHLWGAHAIRMALSVVCHPSSIVRCWSSVSTRTTRNNYYDVVSIFGANVYHVPGLCLLGIGGAPYISHKIMAQKPYFHIFDFFSKTTFRWCFILGQKIS